MWMLTMADAPFFQDKLANTHKQHNGHICQQWLRGLFFSPVSIIVFLNEQDKNKNIVQNFVLCCKNIMSIQHNNRVSLMSTNEKPTNWKCLNHNICQPLYGSIWMLTIADRPYFPFRASSTLLAMSWASTIVSDGSTLMWKSII